MSSTIARRVTTPLGLTRLTFGMVPVSDDERVRVMLGDFCALLSRLVGGAISPHRAPSPASLASAVGAGRVQLAWLSPTLLVTSDHVAGATPLVSSLREGAASFHATLFVRADSAIHSVSDLPGTRAAWVAPTSAAGYLFPRMSLARRGMDPRTMFASEAFLQSHGEVARAVLRGDADVGATFGVFEHGDPAAAIARAGFLEAGTREEFRIVDTAGPIPSDVIVAAQGVTAGTRAHVAASLASLEDDAEGRELVHTLFGADGFRAFSGSSLTELRSAAQAGRELGLLG